MDLSITNLEAERQRRQVEQTARIVRSGQMPPVTIATSQVSSDEWWTSIKIGESIIKVASERGPDPRTKKTTMFVSNLDVEEKILQLFPDQVVAKKLYDHVFNCLEKDMRENNGTLERYGDTKFFG